VEALTTRDEFYAFTGMTLPEDRVDLLLDIASGIVRARCGWHIAPSVTETLTVDGSGSSLLALPTLHLTALSSVTEDGEVVDLDDVQWSTVGLLTRATAWTTRLNGVSATITHGHTTAPAAVVGIVLMAAARASASPTGVVREQVGEFSVTYSQHSPNQAGGVVLLEHEQRVLERYSISNPA